MHIYMYLYIYIYYIYMCVCLCVYPYIEKSIDQLKAISASSLSLLRNESPSVASFAARAKSVMEISPLSPSKRVGGEM